MGRKQKPAPPSPPVVETLLTVNGVEAQAPAPDWESTTGTLSDDDLMDRGPGRPPNSPNVEYVDVVDATLTRCKGCGSTLRTPYRKDPTVHRQPFEDKTIVTTWKKTRCGKCGRPRRDKYVTEELS